MKTSLLRRQVFTGFTLAGLALLPQSFGAPPSYAPPGISARFNIRYFWGLSKEERESLGKDRMRTSDRYNLPASKAILKDGTAEQTIQGAVEGFPFTFYLRLSRSSDTDEGLLEINVVDQRTHRPLSGFPQKLPHALPELKSEEGVEVDLKLSNGENAVVLDWLRASLKQSGTKVGGPVVIEMPFLQVHAVDPGDGGDGQASTKK